MSPLTARSPPPHLCRSTACCCCRCRPCANNTGQLTRGVGGTADVRQVSRPHESSGGPLQVGEPRAPRGDAEGWSVWWPPRGGHERRGDARGLTRRSPRAARVDAEREPRPKPSWRGRRSTRGGGGARALLDVKLVRNGSPGAGACGTSRGAPQSATSMRVSRRLIVLMMISACILVSAFAIWHFTIVGRGVAWRNLTRTWVTTSRLGHTPWPWADSL